MADDLRIDWIDQEVAGGQWIGHVIADVDLQPAFFVTAVLAKVYAASRHPRQRGDNQRAAGRVAATAPAIPPPPICKKA